MLKPEISTEQAFARNQRRAVQITPDQSLTDAEVGGPLWPHACGLVCAEHLADGLFRLGRSLRHGHLARHFLRVAPVVQDADLMHALQGAGRGAPLLRAVLALKIFHRVLFKRDAWIAALLRAPLNKAVFADVEVARSGTAAPVVRLALGDAVLKPVEARVVAIAQLL